jgi:hypothetical protein
MMTYEKNGPAIRAAAEPDLPFAGFFLAQANTLGDNS